MNYWVPNHWALVWSWPLQANHLLLHTGADVYVPVLGHALGRADLFPSLPLDTELVACDTTVTFRAIVAELQKYLHDFHPSVTWANTADTHGYITDVMQEQLVPDRVRCVLDAIVTELARPHRLA